jgi:hypothetical protein
MPVTAAMYDGMYFGSVSAQRANYQRGTDLLVNRKNISRHSSSCNKALSREEPTRTPCDVVSLRAVD